MTQAIAPGARPGPKEPGLAAPAVQSAKRLEFGIGLAHDALVPASNDWYGVYLSGIDRVAERNTVYGRLRENPRFGIDYGKTPTTACCPAMTSLEQFASVVSAREVSPVFFFYGLLREKKWGLELDDGWKLQAGYRRMQYTSTVQTRVGFLTIERYWENVRTTYSYQLERSRGASAAPSHVVRLDYLFNPRDSIGFSFAHGREHANFGPQGVLNTEVRSATLRGQHWFKRAWALTFQAGYNDHGNMPAHSGVRLGVRHSF